MTRADHAIASQFGQDRFVTALLCDLDLASGLLSWIPCGHPPPLLIRGNRTVKELARAPQPPLGLARLPGYAGLTYDADAVIPYTEKLEPGDRVLLYTDGVTEGRAADGTPFGLRRLSDFIIRHSSAGLPASETMRRLNRAIVDYQHGRLHDDVTWHPAREGAWNPCKNADEVVRTLLWRADANRLQPGEMIAVGDRVLIQLRGKRLERLGAKGFIPRLFQVIVLREGKVSSIRDYPKREEALADAGIKA